MWTPATRTLQTRPSRGPGPAAATPPDVEGGFTGHRSEIVVHRDPALGGRPLWPWHMTDSSAGITQEADSTR